VDVKNKQFRPAIEALAGCFSESSKGQAFITHFSSQMWPSNATLAEVKAGQAWVQLNEQDFKSLGQLAFARGPDLLAEANMSRSLAALIK